ncbi:MAG: RagB/SusD family nutrient uptake outer membrane protein, partial [Odoribacter splanchnicus]
YGHPELWNKVAEVCQEVINSGEYSLLGSPQEFNLIGLKGNSTEGIFEIDHSYDSSNDLKDYGSYIAGFCQRWPVQPMTTPTTKRTPRMSYTVFNQIYPDRNDKRRTANAEDPDYWEQQPSTTTQGAVYIKKWG